MIDKTQRLRGMLGFAMRAGKLLVGTDIICKAMGSSKPPKLVAVSCGASDGTKKKLSTKCEFYGIRMVQINMNTDELGSLIGKTYAPAAVAVMDDGFAKEIEKLADGKEI